MHETYAYSSAGAPPRQRPGRGERVGARVVVAAARAARRPRLSPRRRRRRDEEAREQRRAGRRRATAEAELPQQQQAPARLAHVTLPAAAEAHVAEERVGEPPLGRFPEVPDVPEVSLRICSI